MSVAPFPPRGSFHDDCTVCGRHVPTQPQLTCLYCRARTHTSCAAGPMATTVLYTSELGADRLSSLAASVGEQAVASPPSSPAAASPSLPSSATGVAPSDSCGGNGGKGVSSTPPHPHRHKVTPSDIYFCSPDCALVVGVYANPNFSPELSASVEAELEQRWRAVTRDHDASLEKLRTTLQTLPTPDDDGVAVAAAAEAVYLQLRFDAWCRYVTLERTTLAPPPMLPPSHLVLAEEVLEHVSELVSAAGQAERLYLANARIGSLLALPHDAVWRDVRPIRAGETNNFLAEAAQLVASTTVEPQTTVVHLFPQDGEHKLEVPRR